MAVAAELRSLIMRMAALEAEAAAVMASAQHAVRRATILSTMKDGQLAAIAGCGREHMNKFRNNKVDASLEMLCALAEHFEAQSVVGKSQGESDD